MNLLLHCCCGPCASAAAHFRARGHEVTCLFFNPNLHPPDELLRRQRTFTQAARALDLPVLPGPPPSGLRTFLLALARQPGPRCHACYRLRLEAAASEAAARGFDAFSTTLLISPHQDLDALRSIGQALGARLGVPFFFADLRGEYPHSCERARELGLYRQNYCGCLFSLLERGARRAGRALDRAARRPAHAAEAAS